MIKFNNTEILQAYFNGTRLDNIYFDDQPLLPVDGLFDASGKCLASWHNLVTKYGMDCWSNYTTSGDTAYTSNHTSPYRVLRDNPELAEGTQLIIPDSVTSIGDWAFCECSSLTSITIPSSVTSIGDYAFRNCNGLTSIVFGGNSKLTSIGSAAFYNCDGLTSITIGNGVTSIGVGAFMYCDSLESITLPFVGGSKEGTSDRHFGYIFGARWSSDQVDYVPQSLKTVAITGDTSISFGAFQGCASITSIMLPFVGATKDGTSNTHFGYIFGASEYGDNIGYVPTTLKTVVITGGTSIDEGAFYDCNSLTSIELPNSVTSIGYRALESCKSLTVVEIPNSVTSIGDRAFYGCKELTLIEIPSSVTSIGDYAFASCTALASVVIPDSVTSIGDEAFKDCNNLTYKEYSNACYLGNEGKPYIYLAKAKSQDITSCTIHANTRFIGYHAFYYCSKLTSIKIPNSVTSIGSSAFYSCSGLTSLTIGDNVTSIGWLTFAYCKSLTSITIPDSVTSIGSEAFRGCSGLTQITFGENSKLAEISSYAFKGCDSLISITLPFVGASKNEGETDTYFSYLFGGSSYDDNPSKVPKSITQVTIRGGSIGWRAFYSCPQQLKTVKLEEGVTSIGSWAFGFCDGLKELTIPSSVTSIGSGAFRYCDELKNINFTGTEAQWEAISKNGWNYEMLACTITLSDGSQLYYEKNGRVV